MLRKHAGRRTILTVMAAALIFAAPVSAAEPETVSVGVEELDYFPNYALREGQYVGAARDILDAFAADAGLRLVYRPLPVKRLYADLFAGTVDLKFPDSPGWNAAGKQGQNVVYSRPVLPYIDGVMVTPERKGKGLDGFATLGTVSGFTPFAWLDVLSKGTVKLSENPQIDSLLKQTMAGRVDGAYVSVAAARHQLRVTLNRPDALVFDPGLPHSAGDYVVSTIHRPDVAAKLDAWLAANPGKTAAIKAGYGLTD
jgi:polar amino acid transport system substrate-binding protein